MTTVIQHLNNREELFTLIRRQRAGQIGQLVVKLGAEWCGPCRVVEPIVREYMELSKQSINSVTWCILDVDECTDVYSYFKKQRQVNGIPAVLVWNRHDVDYPQPDASVVGSDIPRLHQLLRPVVM